MAKPAGAIRGGRAAHQARNGTNAGIVHKTGGSPKWGSCKMGTPVLGAEMVKL